MGKKTFYCSNLAYYANAIGRTKKETMISLDSGGGTYGEFAIRWVDIGNDLVPQLQAFDDSWDALSQMPELIESLKEIDNQNYSQSDFNELLLRLGYEDKTPYSDPDGKDFDQINKDILLRTKKDLQKEIDKINKKLEG
jgi:hypothetical protein